MADYHIANTQGALLLNVVSVVADGSICERKVRSLLEEHCDGNRNLLHTCVAMAAPTTNKDNDTTGEIKCLICQNTLSKR